MRCKPLDLHPRTRRHLREAAQVQKDGTKITVYQNDGTRKAWRKTENLRIWSLPHHLPNMEEVIWQYGAQTCPWCHITGLHQVGTFVVCFLLHLVISSVFIYVRRCRTPCCVRYSDGWSTLKGGGLCLMFTCKESVSGQHRHLYLSGYRLQ